MKNYVLSAAFLFVSFFGHSQINAKLMRYADISDQHITFVYGGDLWLVDKNGGTAYQITHSPGEESYPRFSPDGQFIGYTASYQGNSDVYVIPVQGGLPTRVTYASWSDRMIDWHPDGEHLVFASRREIGQRSSQQFFTVSKNGGFAQRLIIPYGELASYSPDGRYMAYITKITENYPFKRYRGGLASDIYIHDFDNHTAVNITDSDAIDGKPAWCGDKLYFLSDQDEFMRLNIWSYDPETKEFDQLTFFEDFDISQLSASGSELIFEAGGSLYIFDTGNKTYAPLDIQIVSDLSVEMPRKKSVKDAIQRVTAAPEGKRIIFEARGELFDVPVKEGVTLNLTNSSGAFDRDPSWSPDGTLLAFWSDRNGENEIYIQKYGDRDSIVQITDHGSGYGYTLYWSPDNEYLAYVDYKNDIKVINVNTHEEVTADNLDWNLGHNSRQGYLISWSPDSKWITYEKGCDNANGAVYVYQMDDRSVHQLTSGYFNDSDPIFGTKGDYIFYKTDRNLRPHYSDMADGTWVYPNATQIAALPLRKEVPHLLSPRNDELSKKKEEKDTSELVVTIEMDQIESRMIVLPADAGNIGDMLAFDGKLVYVRVPNTGSEKDDRSLVLYDFEDREEDTVMDVVDGMAPTADGKKIIVRSKRRWGIIKPSKGQKIKDAISTDGLVMNHVPREEWRQLFNDAWRRHRDFFYDEDMHGLDWEALRTQYGALIEDARTRWDVSFIISNLSAELSAGHTYTFGGDVERVQPQNTGYLGIDWEADGERYRIKRIVRPAVWDSEVRSPFDKTGIAIEEGDYIMSVNGMDIGTDKDPYANFEGLSGKTVILTVSKSGTEDDAEDHIIECLSIQDESRLRHLEWIENNRKKVDELSNGRLGYVYMSNTGGRGQLELVRMYYGQLDKEGFIIDERFNGGGQLADRFLELMKRPVVYNLHWRHGRDHTHPTKTNTGPMGMLINGWAGSGGDGLPWAFQELNAGPIVGERTLGILVGPATGHRLIDGGGITVPGARLYDNDGHWFWEGVGVTPDIEVWDDPNILMQGRDPQIERVVEEVLKNLETNPPMATPAPPKEIRTAAGLNGN